MSLQKLSLSTSGPTSEATSKDTYAYIAPITKNSDSNYKFYAMWTKTDGFWTLLIAYGASVSSPLELTIDDLYFETTDELVLKSDLPPIVDLSDYVSLDHLNTFCYTKTDCDEKFALKSQIEELKTENAKLKIQIASLKPRYSWQNFSLYVDFSERVEFVGYQHVSNVISFQYDSSSNMINIQHNPHALSSKEYLLILVDESNFTHFFRLDKNTNTLYYNENRNFDTTANGTSAGTFLMTLPETLEFTVKNVELKREFKYVFTKPK